MGSQDLSVLDGLDTNAAELRAALAAFQPGVFAAGDFKVTPRGVGANRSIDLAGGRGVIGSPVGVMPTFMGPNYLVGETASINSDAFELGGFAPPHATFARMDQIILRLYDNEGGLKKWRPEVLTGQVPVVNATLDGRQSASNLPAGVPVLRVADVIVPTTGIITATEIRDRRTWARGAFYNSTRTATNLTTASATYVSPDATLWSARIECSGLPVRVSFFGDVGLSAVGMFNFGLSIDGAAAVDGRESRLDTNGAQSPGAVFMPILAAGSHILTLQWRISGGAGTATIYAGSQPSFTVEEILRQNAWNN